MPVRASNSGDPWHGIVTWETLLVVAIDEDDEEV